MSSLKRRSISIGEKISIIDAVDRGDKSKQEIAKQFNIAPSTLSTILKNRETICNNKTLKCKRMRFAEYEDVEQCVSKWFKQCRNQNIPLGGNTIKTKAEEFAGLLGHKDFKASNGWLDNFKKRHDIGFRKVSGESASVSDKVCSDWKKLLPSLLAEYEPHNIFNADETGLFFKCAPDRTMAFKSEKCHGGKHSKERLSILFTVNITGSEKRKLLVIGKSANPRCFKNVKSLPVDNDMTKANRKVLLFVDNCTAHKNVPSLKSIKLQFLPPNATSKLQPLDLGIIKNFKQFYPKEVVKILINDLEEGRKSSINILQGIRMAHKAWESVQKSTIFNCFATCGFVERSDILITENVCIQDSEEWLILKNHFNLTEQFDDFVNFDDNITSTGSLTDDDIIISVTKLQDNGEQEEEETEEMENIVTAKEAKIIIGKLQTFLEAQDSTPLNFKVPSKSSETQLRARLGI
ncbi:tigger transposable element-derived protein 6-like [Lucilia sericata]|uniref:tigger transposable element-derived protein 6-like n=1 Tax=Lucilia sericata TaxID=13632 RepID=UPI0018A7E895|nr:tigger transposable element-derived protein 6-like [Lucilia sericata]